MRKLLTIPFAMLVIFLIASCTSTKPIENRMVGTWKAVTVEPVGVPNLPAGAQTAAQPARAASDSTLAPTHEPSRLESQITRMIDSEMRSTLTINPDKTAIKEYPGKTIHATWKLKKKGTRIVAKSKDTGKNLTLDLLKINDSTVVVESTMQYGTMKITYKKVKK
jgi:hypothetical protein